LRSIKLRLDTSRSLTEQAGPPVAVLEHSRIEEPLGMVYIARWTGILERFGEEMAR
jgi:hypothetical protein